MTGPTTLHDRVAEEAAHQAFIAQQEAAAHQFRASLRTRAIEPPPYRPGNPTWEAGYATAKAQAAALAATAGDPHVRILAMRPTAPKVTA